MNESERSETPMGVRNLRAMFEGGGAPDTSNIRSTTEFPKKTFSRPENTPDQLLQPEKAEDTTEPSNTVKPTVKPKPDSFSKNNTEENQDFRRKPTVKPKPELRPKPDLKSRSDSPEARQKPEIKPKLGLKKEEATYQSSSDAYRSRNDQIAETKSHDIPALSGAESKSELSAKDPLCAPVDGELHAASTLKNDTEKESMASAEAEVQSPTGGVASLRRNFDNPGFPGEKRVFLPRDSDVELPEAKKAEKPKKNERPAVLPKPGIVSSKRSTASGPLGPTADVEADPPTKQEADVASTDTDAAPAPEFTADKDAPSKREPPAIAKRPTSARPDTKPAVPDRPRATTTTALEGGPASSKIPPPPPVRPSAGVAAVPPRTARESAEAEGKKESGRRAAPAMPTEPRHPARPGVASRPAEAASRYAACFHAIADPATEPLLARPASVRDVWTRSKLPTTELAEIWQAVAGSDAECPGLSEAQFVSAMGMIDAKLRVGTRPAPRQAAAPPRLPQRPIES